MIHISKSRTVHSQEKARFYNKNNPTQEGNTLANRKACVCCVSLLDVNRADRSC